MTTHSEVRTCLLVELLLLLLGAGMFVYGDEEIPLILWEEACDSYEPTNGVRQRGPRIHLQYSTPLTQCRSLCTARRDCGGFGWYTGNDCRLYNINDQIIGQYLSQSWYSNSSSWTWYSKTCYYDVGNTDLSCNIYTEREYHNQYPVSKWRITGTYNSWIPDLTATECQIWCTLYTGCRSATYQRVNSNGDGWCNLYSTTIQHLLDSGLDDDVTQYTGTGYNYTTYDRYCVGSTPYIPGIVGCGVQDIVNIIGNGASNSKIVGGTITVSGSWPWQVQLKAYGQHQCGGSILNSGWILTAAQCFDRYSFPSAWTVHAGSWRESSTDGTESIHPVASIVKHSGYSAGSVDNDIALVKLSIPVTYTTHRKAVCLPQSESSVQPGTMCYVTGWGLTHDTGFSGYLKQTYLPIVSETTCRLAHPGMISSNMICAGYTNHNHGPCHRDTGGPLVHEVSGVWYVEGVLSDVDEYCGSDVIKPSVFISTRAYANWIHNTMLD